MVDRPLNKIAGILGRKAFQEERIASTITLKWNEQGEWDESECRRWGEGADQRPHSPIEHERNLDVI